jgi:hypothetical protein
LQPLHNAGGWKGHSDALSAICSGVSIMTKDELPAAQRARKEALHRIARELDAVGPEPKKKDVEDE